MVRTAMAIAALMACAEGTFAQDDVALGHKVFEQHCAECHTVGDEAAKRGPDLAGVVGRPAASIEGYPYTDAMLDAKKAGVVWDVETLGKFITKPRSVVNGSAMTFRGLPNPDDVGNVIAYLGTLPEPAAR